MPEDPKKKGAKPPYPEQEQSLPGLDHKMTPEPDHGEESYKGLGRLKGKAALITGGDSGIGRAVAIAFAREGADVAISYLPEEEPDAERTAEWVSKAGRKIVKLPGDITDEAHCENVVQQVFDAFGKLDVLVNNAAYQTVHEDVDDWDLKEWDHTFRTNIYAPFWMTRAALPRMKAGSSVINTVSIQSYQPKSHLLAYASTKGALLNFTKGLAQIAAKQGVRANAVAPGPVWTPLIPASFPAEKVKEFGKDTVFGRAAQPAEIAPLYVFLASEESNYMAGEVVAATGGKTPF